ncbi:hypothetical protein J1N35_013985, partial [Gossypium stocksii]
CYRGNYEEDESDNNKNGGNHIIKREKPNNRSKGLAKCFLCDSLHMVKDSPKKFVVSTIEGDDG